MLAREAVAPATGIRRGDHLVVAPEPDAPEGSLVMVRHDESVDLCSVTVDAFGQARFTSSDPEELPWPCTAGSVLGILVAAIRHAGDQVLVGFPPHYDFRLPPRQAPCGRLTASEIERLCDEIEELSHTAQTAEHLYPTEARVLRSAAARISTLTKCLAVVTDERLYAAMVEQISRTNRALRRTLASRPQWAVLQRHLADLDRSGPSSPRSASLSK